MVRLVSLLMNTTLTFDVGKDENGNYVRADSPESRTLAHTEGEPLDVDTFDAITKALGKGKKASGKKAEDTPEDE